MRGALLIEGYLPEDHCHIGAYLTTALDDSAAEIYLEYLNNLVHLFMGKHQDSYFVVGGGWNRADTDITFEDFSSITAIPTPLTRGDEKLDIFFTNMASSVVSTEVCPPLVPNVGRPGRPSDHDIVVVGVHLPRNRKFRWMKYSYRKYTKEGDLAFGEWIVGHQWEEVRGSSSEMASALGTTLDRTFFPLITRRLRYDQDPWINDALE